MRNKIFCLKNNVQWFLFDAIKIQRCTCCGVCMQLVTSDERITQTHLSSSIVSTALLRSLH